jgi:hypothetical protein
MMKLKKKNGFISPHKRVCEPIFDIIFGLNFKWQVEGKRIKKYAKGLLPN